MCRRRSRSVWQPPNKVIHLSYWFFAGWWLVILAVHVVTFVFSGLYAYCYMQLKGTYLNLCLEFYHIGMPEPYHYAIAVVHAVLSAIHGTCILLMLGGSLHQKSLAFTPWSSSTVGREMNAERIITSTILQGFSQVYDKIMYPCSLCGVNGKYFESALISREIMETALQTVQAYRMSVLLPRTVLNRFYVVLLAANCWSSIVADTVFFGRDEARRRFACVILDCLLDLMASTGVQLLVIASYIDDYNSEIKGFDERMWYDDEWVARALNEFRMVVVVSRSDLLSHIIFSLGLVITTTSMKRLLWRLPRHVNRVTEATTSIVFAVKTTKIFKGNLIKPEAPPLVEKWNQYRQVATCVEGDKATCKPEGPTFVNEWNQCRQEEPTRVASLNTRVKWWRRHKDRIVLGSVHLLFGVWGIVILGLHIHASVQPTLPQCFMQVRPWTVSRPSCYLVGFDCHLLGISGNKNDVQIKWSEFDASTVVQVLIRHCTEFEVPDIFTEFNSLHGIKVYNTTITAWDESAAITNSNHSSIAALFLVRVNMTDGLLPAGLQSVDFPQSLTDIEFCVTNLRVLPDDLATKWPPWGIFYVESSQLSTFPPDLAGIAPSYLSVAGNPITELPPEIFEIPNLLYLDISNIAISALPLNVTRLSPSLSRIYLIDTNVSFFWSWIDEFVQRVQGTTAPLRASRSTYCNNLEQFLSDNSNSFQVPPSTNHATTLMNPTEETWQGILNTVDCSYFNEDLLYPLSFDDEINAISALPEL